MCNMQYQDISYFIFCVLSRFWKAYMVTFYSIRRYIKMGDIYVTFHNQYCNIVVFLFGDFNTLNGKDMCLFT